MILSFDFPHKFMFDIFLSESPIFQTWTKVYTVVSKLCKSPFENWVNSSTETL